MQPYVFGIPLDSRILVWQVIIIMCIFAGKCNTAMFKLTDSYIADDELFARVQKGDEKAFTIVYGRYNKLIYVLAYRYLLDKARAEDVVQYVFVLQGIKQASASKEGDLPDEVAWGYVESGDCRPFACVGEYAEIPLSGSLEDVAQGIA